MGLHGKGRHLYVEAKRHNSMTLSATRSLIGTEGSLIDRTLGRSYEDNVLGIFLEGLRNRLHQSRAQVPAIKLGFVDTPMTMRCPKLPYGVGWRNCPGYIAKVPSRSSTTRSRSPRSGF